jgi:hypothetical protein
VASGVDKLLSGFGRIHRAVDGNFCAGLSKCDSNGRAKPAGRAGDERYLVFKVELIEYQGNFSFRVGALFA